MRIFPWLALLVVTGCIGDIVELGGSGDGGGDLAQSGPAKFNPTIQMDLDTQGCTAAACHGGTQAPVVKMGATAQADIDSNYMHVMVDVNMTAADQSLLLTKPLQNSGVTHSGTKPFASTSDATYQRWLAWIQAGAPKQ
jgi:hypothetical protein